MKKKPTAPTTRKGSTPIKVYCLPEEKQQIEANAAATGLSTSAYLLKVGLGYRVRSAQRTMWLMRSAVQRVTCDSLKQFAPERVPRCPYAPAVKRPSDVNRSL